MLRCSRNDCR